MSFTPEGRLPLAPFIHDCRADDELNLAAEAVSTFSHRRLLAAALDGKIPAERVNGRWYYRACDRQVIAKALGLLAPPKLGRPVKRRTDASSLQPAAA